MNKLLANFNVLYVKLHTLHYNVIGADFLATHVFLEGEYDLVHNWIDLVAESIKIEGEAPVCTLKEMLEITSIKELNQNEISTKDAYNTVKADYTLLIEEINTLKSGASVTTANLLEEIEMELLKKLWFLDSITK